MERGRVIITALLGAALITSALSGCGSTETTEVQDGAYQKVNLSVAVNGTDTQIDSLVAHHFAELVTERSDGNIVIDVFSKRYPCRRKQHKGRGVYRCRRLRSGRLCAGKFGAEAVRCHVAVVVYVLSAGA